MKTLHKVIAAVSAVALVAGTTAFAASITPSGSPAAVTVSAAVAPYLTLAISSNSINLGTLNVGSVTTAAAAHTVTATSNGTDYAVSYAVVGGNAGATADVLAMAGATGNAATSQVGLTVASDQAGLGAGQVINQTSFKVAPTVATIDYTAADATGKQAGAYSATVTYTATGNY